MEERKEMPEFFSGWESLLSAFLTSVSDLLVSSARQARIQNTVWILCKVPWTYDLGGPLAWDLMLCRTLPPAADSSLLRGLPTVAEGHSTEWRDAGCPSLYILTLSPCPTALYTVCYTLTESPSIKDHLTFLTYMEGSRGVRKMPRKLLSGLPGLQGFTIMMAAIGRWRHKSLLFVNFVLSRRAPPF